MTAPRGGLLALCILLGWLAVGGVVNAVLLGSGAMEPHIPRCTAVFALAFGVMAAFALVQVWRGSRLAILAFRLWVMVALAMQATLVATPAREVYPGGVVGILGTGGLAMVLFGALDRYLDRRLVGSLRTAGPTGEGGQSP